MYGNETILIVDDDARMCESIQGLLSNQGYATHITTTGEQAIDYLSGGVCDLILLDMMLPDMNGNTVMDYINSKDLETLIIVITGHSSEESAITSLRKGAYDYIKKPFEPDELIKRVENAFYKKRFM